MGEMVRPSPQENQGKKQAAKQGPEMAGAWLRDWQVFDRDKVAAVAMNFSWNGCA
jgi:hypothetical protein